MNVLGLRVGRPRWSHLSPSRIRHRLNFLVLLNHRPPRCLFLLPLLLRTQGCVIVFLINLLNESSRILLHLVFSFEELVP